ncbi:putative cytoplasmic protein [Salmonella enterica subsp. enterica serovar Alachua str. R6-377]|uniref:Putative cytoplasmic protein n=1 Tax=Salmonella enterica subsp. enterica serovar Alachua str. R6-377 TaxID=913241 RepID=G5LP37_SALET|nr:putative cytoplasmic protein [Salmonella enterica subsp. enterica serovar Alachua str. R6-377]
MSPVMRGNLRALAVSLKGENTMMTYDRNRNAITTGSRVMISGTGHTGIIKAIESEGLDAGQIRRGPRQNGDCRRFSPRQNGDCRRL